jgi:hypothetical protein
MHKTRVYRWEHLTFYIFFTLKLDEDFEKKINN